MDDARPTIVVPLDFGSSTQPALRRASELARASDGRLILLHVIPPMNPEPPSGLDALSLLHTAAQGWGYRQPPNRLPETMSRKQAEARARLAVLAEEDYLGDVPTQAEVRVGEPEQEIVAIAREMRAAMLVLGSRKKSWLLRLWRPGVVGAALKHAPCPVMVVPASSTGRGTPGRPQGLPLPPHPGLIIEST